MSHDGYLGPQVRRLLITGVTTSDDLSRAEVRLSGELDGCETGSLQATLDRLLHRGYQQIDVDLADLRFLAGAGLTVFVRAHDRAVAAGVHLVLTRPTPMITRILQITELDHVLKVRADRGTAGRCRRRPFPVAVGIP